MPMPENYIARIVDRPISPEEVVSQAQTASSGCVVTYVGLIREESRGKAVKSVEYTDVDGKSQGRLTEIAADIMRKHPVNSVVIYHRVGVLNVEDINLVVAIGAAHRSEGFAASQYAIDQFKEKLPTGKIETYVDGSTWTGD
jgi:molybdopterin synthase catalytic subunit